MARWPAPGRCKRRLAASIGARQAAAIQARLSAHVLQEAQAEGRRLLDLPLLWPRALAITEALVNPWLGRGVSGPRGLAGPGSG